MFLRGYSAATEKRFDIFLTEADNLPALPPPEDDRGKKFTLDGFVDGGGLEVEKAGDVVDG